MKQPPMIAPSILSANFAKLGEEVNAVLAAGAGIIHFDVMDNHSVPNLTIGPVVLKSLRKYGITADIDVHLMVEPVDRLVEDFIKAGATIINFHPETTQNVKRLITLCKQNNVKVGLVLNPDKPLDLISEYLADMDTLLLMTVFPGFGGQAFIPDVLTKIAKARDMIDQINKPIRLKVDGGIKTTNIADVSRHGADTFIAGSAIFESKDYKQVIQEMLEKAKI